MLSRAYYAMFHLTQAMLATEDLFRRRHGAVHALFNERFVRTGRVPLDTYRWLATAFEQRQWADYDPEGEPPLEQAEAALVRARSFRAGLAPYLADWLSTAPHDAS